MLKTLSVSESGSKKCMDTDRSWNEGEAANVQPEDFKPLIRKLNQAFVQGPTLPLGASVQYSVSVYVFHQNRIWFGEWWSTTSHKVQGPPMKWRSTSHGNAKFGALKKFS